MWGLLGEFQIVVRLHYHPLDPHPVFRRMGGRSLWFDCDTPPFKYTLYHEFTNGASTKSIGSWKWKKRKKKKGWKNHTIAIPTTKLPFSIASHALRRAASLMYFKIMTCVDPAARCCHWPHASISHHYPPAALMAQWKRFERKPIPVPVLLSKQKSFWPTTLECLSGTAAAAAA